MLLVLVLVLVLVLLVLVLILLQLVIAPVLLLGLTSVLVLLILLELMIVLVLPILILARVLVQLVLAQKLKHSTYIKDPVELKSASHSFNRMVLIMHSYPKICDRGIGHSFGWIHGSFSFSWEHEADGIRPRGGTYNEYIMLDSASTCKIHKRYK